MQSANKIQNNQEKQKHKHKKLTRIQTKDLLKTANAHTEN